MTFDDLHSAYHAYVRCVLSQKLPVDAVEDAEQELWLRAAQHVAHIRKPRQWLNKVIAAVTSSHYRRSAHNFPTLSDCAEPPPTDGDPTHDWVALAECYHAARAVLNGTTPARRARVASYMRNHGERSHSPAERIAMHHFRRELVEKGVTL